MGVSPENRVFLAVRPQMPKASERKAPEKKLPDIFLAISFAVIGCDFMKQIVMMKMTTDIAIVMLALIM